MTNKQTIDGVSREKIQRAIHCILNGTDTMVEAIALADELRALLDKPDTPYTQKVEWSFEYIDGGDIVIRNGEDWTLIKRGDGPIYEQFLYRFCEEQLKPAAQPQGEVERLREEIERRRIRGQNCSNKVSTLRAQLAERDALLRDAFTLARFTLPDAWHARYWDLSTSAEPKPRGEVDGNYHAPKQQGEPVAWMALNSSGFPEKCMPTDPLGFPVYAEQPTPVALTIPDECPHIIVFDDADREQLMFAGSGARSAALKAWDGISRSWNAHLFVRVERNSRDDRYPSATSAPVAVVLPERKGESTRGNGWNACLDEVAKLNGIKP